jgi:hypothetical protein
MAKRILLALACCLAVLALGEAWLHRNLFRHVSYSNSESIDAQLRDRDAGGPWKMIFVGDSEVRWGIDPEQIDAGFRDAGQEMLSFNHAFDGFGASWWPALLPRLLTAPSLQSVETVVVGVQLVDNLRVMRATGEDCGALQRPVLTSAFAVDIGAEEMCSTRAWDARLGKDLFGFLWTVHYAPAVRSLVLPDALFKYDQLRFNSRKAAPPRRGFQAHRAIADDEQVFASEFARWKAQYQPERDFGPLEPQAWPALVHTGGFFDQLRQVVEGSGKRLALYALPTNPLVIDTFRRRGDYQRNSALLAQWAAQRRIVYVDLGLQDRPDATRFFSDMRHLSGAGAAEYSRLLGSALAQAQQAWGRPPVARVGHSGGDWHDVGTETESRTR